MHPARRTLRPIPIFALAPLLAVLPACSPRNRIEPLPVEINGDTRAAHEARIEAIRSDPLAYLAKVLENCRTLESYTVAFTRQERRGLGIFKTLHEPERIACKFRRRPFSVYMRWLDPEVKYGESTYVAGQEADKVRFIPRNGLFGLSPTLHKVELTTPVTWGEARYPMTEFGLERMMERTLTTLSEAGDEYTVSYEGLTQIAGHSGAVHFFRFELPPRKFPASIREVYIDAASDLPAATRILFPSGRLDAAYVWSEVNPAVTFSDEDFLLEAERRLGK